MKIVIAIAMVLLSYMKRCAYADDDGLLVKMTLVRNASAFGAFCLDGSSPAYHLHRGFGDGASNWLLQFEAGGWCNDRQSCRERANTRHGSTLYMSKMEVFSGILSNNASRNPDFYNWNRVKLRYCDGASFAGNSKYDDGKSVLYFRGKNIWEAIIHDLLSIGLGSASKALLSGCSAGGLATFVHCDNFARILPPHTTVKCLSDAGFFMDEIDIALNHTMRSFYEKLFQLQGIKQNLNENCTSSLFHELCIFPQYALKYIETPFFILNSAYDVYQFHHILVPPQADPQGRWSRCKGNPAACNPNQITILQGFRHDMLAALRWFLYSSRRGGGMYINSCFAHCQSESQDTWFADDSPRIHNKSIAEAVGDWYFSRRISKTVDCPYPCDTTCHNLLP